MPCVTTAIWGGGGAVLTSFKSLLVFFLKHLDTWVAFIYWVCYVMGPGRLYKYINCKPCTHNLKAQWENLDEKILHWFLNKNLFVLFVCRAFKQCRCWIWHNNKHVNVRRGSCYPKRAWVLADISSLYCLLFCSLHQQLGSELCSLYVSYTSKILKISLKFRPRHSCF